MGFEVRASEESKVTLVAEQGGVEHTLTITLPRVAYRATPIGFEDGMALYDVACNVFHDASSGYPIDITVRNNIASYLA